MGKARRINSKVIPIFRSKMLATGDIGAAADGTPMMGHVDQFGNLWVTIAGGAGGASVINSFSASGSTLVVEPGQWSEFSTPAANTQATATRAADPGAYHVARTISASINAVAAQVVQTLQLLDGAAVLWERRLGPVLAGDSKEYTYTVNIPGTANTDLTLAFTAAPAATNFNSVDLTGYDVSV